MDISRKGPAAVERQEGQRIAGEQDAALEEYDLSGKTIIPFVTSGGSGFSKSISEIQNLQPNAEVLTEGYKVHKHGLHPSRHGIPAFEHAAVPMPVQNMVQDKQRKCSDS